ncbi:hypothetical protein RND71_011264 [Anisodus tanguticus]|uniref:Uncharacterized protein n=1 Tax=Anisodus tanguticus TaxID=243964 RepID=A0AAE1SDE0_9SOLA|nr:hypothetical protein RND71_011264 [Anisodus tanguticus]
MLGLGLIVHVEIFGWKDNYSTLEKAIGKGVGHTQPNAEARDKGNMESSGRSLLQLQRLCSLYKLALNLRMDRSKILAVFLSFLLVTWIQCRPIARITNHSLHSESIKHSNPQSGDHNQGMKVHQLGGSSLSLIEAKNSGPSPGEGHAVAHGAHNDHQ